MPTAWFWGMKHVGTSSLWLQRSASGPLDHASRSPLRVAEAATWERAQAAPGILTQICTRRAGHDMRGNAATTGTGKPSGYGMRERRPY
jgi:hypothetical protein